MTSDDRHAQHQADFDAALHNAIVADDTFKVAVFRECEGQYDAFSREFPDLTEYAGTAEAAMELIVDSVKVTRTMLAERARSGGHPVPHGGAAS